MKKIIIASILALSFSGLAQSEHTEPMTTPAADDVGAIQKTDKKAELYSEKKAEKKSLKKSQTKKNKKLHGKKSKSKKHKKNKATR